MNSLIKILALLFLVSFVVETRAEFLDTKEAIAAEEYLNDICIDTFCGGDFNFTNISVRCDKFCSITYDIAPYYPEYLNLSTFDQASWNERNGYGDKVHWKLIKARNFLDYYYGQDDELVEFENVKIKAQCQIYKLQDNGMSLTRKIELLYDKQLKCVSEFSRALRAMRSPKFSY